MIIRLPGGRFAGERRDHFQHVIDVVPTVLDLIGIEAPRTYRGLDQLPLDGHSMRPTLEQPRTASRERTQYFEMVGHRGVWKDGWKAVAFHPRGKSFHDDHWELYHVDEDFSECHDRAAERPDKLAELIAAWWVEAGRNNVCFPLTTVASPNAPMLDSARTLLATERDSCINPTSTTSARRRLRLSPGGHFTSAPSSCAALATRTEC